MKKLLLTLGLSTLMSMPLAAQGEGNVSPTASRDLYNFEKYDMWKVLDYFNDLDKKGQIFPTAEEFKNQFGIEPERMRSHVAKRMVLMGKENENRLHPNRSEERDLWMNIPAGYGKILGGYPSGTFTDEPYTMWQYTELFGSWNHGLFQAPGSWADAAHKHGTDIMSGMMFFDTTGGRGQGSESYANKIRLVENGRFKYVRPYIHLLMYLGLDGINYNWEASGLYDYKAFHLALREYADEVGFGNYRQGIYGIPSSFNNSVGDTWLYDRSKGKNIGDLMFNYGGSIGQNAEASKNYSGSYKHAYQGYWIVGMNKSWSSMESTKGNVCLWGEHGETRFYQNNSGTTDINKMENLQELYERAFSGGSQNPAIEDSWERNGDWDARLKPFGGLCRLFTERTTIKQNLPFQTFFNLGNGERWFYKGKTASKSPWYNLSSQDMMPTYRWLQYKKDTKIATQPVLASFTYSDAYIGGSSLRLSRKKGAPAGQDLILYRGLLTVSGANAKARLAIKNNTFDSDPRYPSGKNHLSLLLHIQGDEANAYRVYELADNSQVGWAAQEVELFDLKEGDIIDFVGLRVGENAPSNYEIFVGEITLSDDSRTATPQQPVNLRAEIKAETPKSLAAFLSWDGVLPEGVQGRRAKFGMIYNDELNVNHFEVFYKNGENGQPREIGRTSSWNAYIPTLTFEKAQDERGAERPYVGVRAVGTDLKSMSEIAWLKLERTSPALLPKERDLRYCIPELDKGANGASIAQQIRWLSSVSTTGAEINLNYTSNKPDEDGDNYVDATDIAFQVRQGQNIAFTFKGYGVPSGATKDGLQYCWAQTYVDWNNDGIFDAEGDEAIQELALGAERKSTPQFQSPNGVTRNFQVPEDAARGEVRLRIVFTDAWFPKPTPCSKTNKGFAIDFKMKIVGDNQGREAIDTHDQGEPEAPEASEQPKEDPKTDSVDEVEVATPSFYPNPVADKLFVEGASHVWIFSLDGVLVKNVAGGAEVIDVTDLAAGTYVIKLEQDRVTRSYKLIKK